jgi:hypothetical protein
MSNAGLEYRAITIKTALAQNRHEDHCITTEDHGINPQS